MLESAHRDPATPEELKELNEGLREALTDASEGDAEGGERHHRSSRRRKHSRRKKMKGSKIALIVVGALLGVVLIAAASFFVLQRIGAGRLSHKEAPAESAAEKMAEKTGEKISYEEGVITYNGAKYRYNEDLVTVLFMGIDRSLQEENTVDNVIGMNGQADTLILGVVDNRHKKITLINISRDTIAPIALYNTDGQYMRHADSQICLAFAFGDGREKSCENVVEAVSNYFYGIPISSYAAIDYEGIGVLTDTVGGVEVAITDDYFAKTDPSMIPGNTVRLDGWQAMRYVRSRDSYSVEANNGRMQRQKQFLLGLIKQTLEATKQNFTMPLALYNSVSDYTVTDLTAPDITYLAATAVQYGFQEENLRGITGEIRDENEHAAFYADEKKFYELVLEVFYEKE